MVEIRYEEASNELFAQAVQKLVRAPMPVKIAYQIKKMADDLNSLRKKIAEEYQAEVIAKYKPEGETNESFELPKDKMDEFMKVQQEFGQKIGKIDRHKIWVHEIGNAAGISAQEVNALMPILTEEPHHAQISQIQG